jgi:cation:H+ antiporter
MVGACLVFTNAIEWLGYRCNLSKGAVGSILAAVGTALPETLLPIVALVSGAIAGNLSPQNAALIKQNAQHIGIGAILGAPFLLSTLAFCLVGVATYGFAGRQKRGIVLHIDLHLLKRDLTYFFVAYGVAFGMTFVSFQPIKWVVAGGLIVFYGVYLYRTLRMAPTSEQDPDLEPLMMAPKYKLPSTSLIGVQVTLGLLGIILVAYEFVQQLNHLSTLLKVSPLLISLLISPIATELPEKFNSIIWISKKKDQLALSNISGAMVLQSCIPTAIGLAFTPWILNDQGILSILLCFASAGMVFASVVYHRYLSPNVLLLGGLFYLVFLFYSVFKMH